ncbi:MAG: hypothetical protein CMJ49_09100 [Planctomycetaceae bacterium]|nr:hypothetical protein [Planctomycetaceae bacterium]
MPDSTTQIDPSKRRLRLWIFYPLALGLIVASAVVAVRDTDFSPLSRADPATVALLLGLVIVNALITAVLFWSVTIPFAHDDQPVRFADMTALVFAGTLLNYLPLRPGLIGRAAYLKHRHNIGYRHTTIALILVIIGSVLVYAVVGGATLITDPAHTPWWIGIALVFFIASGLARPWLAKWGHRESLGLNPRVLARWSGLAGLAPLTAWLIVRWTDLLTTAARLFIAFNLVGHPIGIPEAIVLASAGMFITLVGPMPNGIGLREWLYGLIAASGLFTGDVEGALQLALAAGLIDRAAEVLIILPSGVISLAYLKKRTPGPPPHDSTESML